MRKERKNLFWVSEMAQWIKAPANVSEFDSQDPHDRGKEPVLQVSSASAQVPWYLCVLVCMSAHIHKYIFLKEYLFSWNKEYTSQTGFLGVITESIDQQDTWD